jgi:squalene-associated FAD-dependent desaturase
VTRAAVVGGGLAGIAAALELADAGACVTVLEARPRLGGATFSVQRDGLWLDNGQHVFLRCCTAYRGLLERLGVAAQTSLQPRLAIPVLRPGRGVAWLRRGALPAPLHLAGALARYGPLAAGERLAVLRAVRALRRLRLDDPALDRTTFGAWLASRGQTERSVAVLWDLITLPTVNLPAAEASLALAAKVFKTGLLEQADAADVGYAAVPLQRLHGEAAERALAAAGVEVLTRTRALALAARSVSWEGGGLEADAVVVAVPHDEAAALVPAGALPNGVDLARLGTSPILNLHVVYDRRVTEHAFAAAIDSPIQWVFDRSAAAGLREGQYLAVSLSGAADAIERPLAELRAAFEPALADLFPAARPARVVSFYATREPRATFRGVPGTAAHRPGPRTRLSGVYIAGAWTDTGWPATMEGAVRSGLAAARAALADAGEHLREAA